MIRRTLHIALATAMLLSVVGLPYYEHFCKGVKETTSLFVPVEACGMEVSEAAQPESCCSAAVATHCAASHEANLDLAKTCCSAEETDHSDCCSDELDWEQADNDLAFSDYQHLQVDALIPVRPIVSEWEFCPISLDRTSLTIRPPPEPLPSSIRRASLQVFLC